MIMQIINGVDTSYNENGIIESIEINNRTFKEFCFDKKGELYIVESPIENPSCRVKLFISGTCNKFLCHIDKSIVKYNYVNTI